MSTPRTVILDLLPVYVTGEASPDTRALVEEAISADPSLQAEIGTLSHVPDSFDVPPAALGLDTLKRTQKLLRRRSLLTGFSIFFSTLPLALVARNWGLPAHLAEVASLLAAFAGWALFIQNAQKLHVCGFEGKRSRFSYSSWYAASLLCALSFCLCMEDWTGHSLGSFAGIVTALFWCPVYWLGLRFRQLHDPSDLLGPKSLMTIAREEDEV